MADPPITREQMDAMLQAETLRYTSAVMRMVDSKCTTQQLVALCLCGYNIGLPLLEAPAWSAAPGRRLCRRRARLRLWNKYRPGGRGRFSSSPGARAGALGKRPSALTADATAATPPASPGRRAEGKLTASPIARTGTVTAGAGVIAAVRNSASRSGR